MVVQDPTLRLTMTTPSSSASQLIQEAPCEMALEVAVPFCHHSRHGAKAKA